MKKNSNTETIILKNRTEDEWTLIIEPEVTPYQLVKNVPVEVEFVGGDIAGNLSITIDDKLVHIEEIDRPYAKHITCKEMKSD